ncbi:MULTISPECIES: transcriptional regulator GutM [Bacillaceae]|uniref:transcriptional regulator GutM n=1 Tax=Bacillaceae TaxID=186817 RepID=UPI001E30D161|nr:MULTISPECIES: transcriptional regulator GutM [Bacillaceae]MCE4047612.1 transcriptional regulator GutM [Bacillus sp. Au-Bac7]MCM3031058.1 transcriptional regulator GutM [Niallia sp. MER 6]MDL0437351.1 transcriptional regulator GutM [Niallia sp. SS-2023]UPO86046.1 transcriptional regulator GutM [Niallia sp. Man26]
MQLAFILCLILIVQYLLSLFQIKQYKKNIDKIVSGYKGQDGFFMFSGMTRGKLKHGAIAVLIVDSNYIIHECHLLKGMSVLTKFKAMEIYKGKHVGEIVSYIHDEIPNKGKNKLPSSRKALLQASENALLTIAKKKVSLGV